MNRLFASEQDAALFYKKYNPNLRGLNAHDTNISDWDPKTMLRYRLHTYGHEKMTLKPWDGVIENCTWLPKPYSVLGSKGRVELGKAMAKGPGEPMAEFPECASEDCWCYDCLSIVKI